MKSRPSGKRVRNERRSSLQRKRSHLARAKDTFDRAVTAFPAGSAPVVRKYYFNGSHRLIPDISRRDMQSGTRQRGPANKSFDYLIGEHAVSDSLSFNWNPMARVGVSQCDFSAFRASENIIVTAILTNVWAILRRGRNI